MSLKSLIFLRRLIAFKVYSDLIAIVPRYDANGDGTSSVDEKATINDELKSGASISGKYTLLFTHSINL